MTNNSNATIDALQELMAAFFTLEVSQSLELSWQGDPWLNVQWQDDSQMNTAVFLFEGRYNVVYRYITDL